MARKCKKCQTTLSEQYVQYCPSCRAGVAWRRYYVPKCTPKSLVCSLSELASGEVEVPDGRGYFTTRAQFNSMRQSAKKRGVEFDLTVRYLDILVGMQGGVCAMSGVPLRYGPGALAGTGPESKVRTMTLCRKDPRQGYVEGNVAWVHRDVGAAKRFLTDDVFLAMCMRVVVNAGLKITE